MDLRQVTTPKESLDGSVYKVWPCSFGVFAKPGSGANDGRIVRTQRRAAESTGFVAAKADRDCNAGHLRPLGGIKKDHADAFSNLDDSGKGRTRPIKPLSEPVFDERSPVGHTRLRPRRAATQPHYRSRHVLKPCNSGQKWPGLLAILTEIPLDTTASAPRRFATC